MSDQPTTVARDAAPTRFQRARRWGKRIGLVALVLVVALGLLVANSGGRWIDVYANSVHNSDPRPVSASDRATYDRVPKVDLHADSLLWDRDLAQRNGRGHVDLPRLLEAGVTVQVFGLVTKVPYGNNYDSNPSDEDALGLVAVLNHWPRSTWGGIRARALHQAARLHGYAAASSDQLVVLRTVADLEGVLARRAAGEPVVGGLLGLEGLQVLEDDLAGLDELFEAGVRMGGLAHFADNEVAGSLSGEDKYGLTEFGAAAVRRMQELGMIIDLAHVSPAAFADTLAIATRPVVVSHTGVTATCPGNRNLSDDQLRAVAANGGVVGIGFWAGAVCGTDAAAIARAIAHAVAVAGIDHVGLGSDFDGTTTTPFDVTGLPQLVAAMRDAGLSDADIHQVLGGNALRVLMAALPDPSTP